MPESAGVAVRAKGRKWLRRTMSEAAWAAAHSHGTYFAAQFRRIAARRGKKRADIAVAHSLLVTGYTMVTNQCHYREVGATFFDGLQADKTKKSALKKLQALRYEVTLKTKATASPAWLNSSACSALRRGVLGISRLSLGNTRSGGRGWLGQSALQVYLSPRQTHLALAPNPNPLTVKGARGGRIESHYPDWRSRRPARRLKLRSSSGSR